jgi:outer membrane protein TolC
MNPSFPMPGLIALALTATSIAIPWTAPAQVDSRSALTLERAVGTALASDEPRLARHAARARSLEQSAVAEAQLPDPVVTGQFANLPVDSFALDEHAMTQLKFGVRQEFPPGDTRALRGERHRRLAEAERARRLGAEREIALEVRTGWFDAAWHERASDVIQSSRESVREQIEALSASFATGRMNAQDVLRAELELALLDDQLAEHRRLARRARAGLARYIGRDAYAPLANDWPVSGSLPDRRTLRQRLVDHPAVAAEDAEIAAAESGVAAAEAQYKPAFALEGGYGIRTEFADFASVGITLSLPLFADKRQDRRRSAAVERRSAERFDRDALLRDLDRRLDEAWTDWTHYRERLALYREALEARARQTADASVTAYANRQTDFAELIRSQLAELDVALKRAELEAEAGKAWSRIVYLTGESS